MIPYQHIIILHKKLRDEIFDHIAKHFPVSLGQYLHVLPFLSLNQAGI